MGKNDELEIIIDQVNTLINMYGEIVDDLVYDIEKRDKKIEELEQENELLKISKSEIEEAKNKLEDSQTEKLKEIATLKQKKTPDLDKIESMIGKLQEILLNVNETTINENNQDTEKSDECGVFDLSADKASDDDL